MTAKIGFNTEERIIQLQAPYKHPIAGSKTEGEFLLA